MVGEYPGYHEMNSVGILEEKKLAMRSLYSTVQMSVSNELTNCHPTKRAINGWSKRLNVADGNSYWRDFYATGINLFAILDQ